LQNPERSSLSSFYPLNSGEPKSDIITFLPDLFARLIARGKPMLTFASHPSTWELPAVGVASLGARSAGASFIK
jgi:hypothetical protein